MDLLDLWRGGLTLRRVSALVDNLPRDAATCRAVYGEVAEWGPSERILADVFDVLAQANWQRGGNKNAPRPKGYPRPRSKQDIEALGRRLRRLKAKGGQDD